MKIVVEDALAHLDAPISHGRTGMEALLESDSVTKSNTFYTGDNSMVCGIVTSSQNPSK